ncbi:MAG: KpsF/GutQ family sugar-phosphate isomerase [Myxococcaceae bacterium]|nr:KpsF/GutQ family sugar-phosphate isomerase [Myxococcaceae bacterium]MCI0669022.1 KpsF/GutQ family sugar-phosphate isomerase [Myxococcaceae bacterium]
MDRRLAALPVSPPAAPDALAYAREVLEVEARAILSLTERLGEPFLEALTLMRDCPGQVVVTGMGKPGFIAQKLSATLASVGVRSVYLHPAEAVHGDLGRVADGDVVLCLSNSGTTEEVVRLLPPLKRLGARLVALTGDAQSPLGQAADVVLDIGRIAEACPMGLVPTASTAVLHALGDALVMTLMRERQFTREAYARLHPGGKIGRSVMRVGELMRTGASLPRVAAHAPLSEVVVVMTNTPGRPGAACVVDAQEHLVGIFTDGDLRRRVERGQTDFTTPVGDVVGRQPKTAFAEELVLAAAERMHETGVDQLPVVDAEGHLVGLLDVQDLLASRLV